MEKNDNNLDDKELRYRAILDQTYQFITLMTTDGTLIETNQASLKFIARQESELIGKTFWETPWWTHSKEEQKKVRNAIQKASEGTFVRFETTHQALNGEIHYFDFSIKPVNDENGVIILLISEGRDITERKQVEIALNESELRFNNIINFLPDATFAINQEGIVIAWNKAIEKITAVKSEDILGKGNFEYSLPFYGERRPILIDLIFGDPNEIESHYVNIKREDNTLIAEIFVPEVYQGKGAYLWGIAAPLYDNTGAFVGAIESIRDINERKMTLDALNQTRKKLNIVNMIVLKDIQNAIFSLSGFLELESMNAKDKACYDFLPEEITIVKTIMESLKFAENYQNLGLRTPVWQSINSSFLFGISHLDFSNVSRDLNVDGIEIFADPMLENVFFNLAENVVVHGKTATKIALWYEETPEGLRLIFEDNGIGIPKEMKEKIFDRKYGEKKGTGLFLSRETLSITGISLVETGIPKKGARFEILVPKGAFRFT